MTTTYRLRQIGHALRHGRATIEGRATLGHCWPDQPHAWVVTLHDAGRTVHVPCADRPSWGARYARREEGDRS